VDALRIFSCFDPGQDADLHALLAQQCVAPGSVLSLVDWSKEEAPHAGWEQSLRERISGVDALVVICTEHTETAFNVNRELGIAQEQGKPYVLLRGRRAGACTKPVLARGQDHFYTWIWDILTSQLGTAMRTRPDDAKEQDSDPGGLRGRRG
jgi:hypothetical protein